MYVGCVDHSNQVGNEIKTRRETLDPGPPTPTAILQEICKKNTKNHRMRMREELDTNDVNYQKNWKAMKSNEFEKSGLKRVDLWHTVLFLTGP